LLPTIAWLIQKALAYLGYRINLNFEDQVVRRADECGKAKMVGVKGTPLPWDQETLNATGLLLSRDWFKRFWILQEISLSNQSSAQVLCGSDPILWSHMRADTFFIPHIYVQKDLLLEQLSFRQKFDQRRIIT
jgi:hypothetical protein